MQSPCSWIQMSQLRSFGSGSSTDRWAGLPFLMDTLKHSSGSRSSKAVPTLLLICGRATLPYSSPLLGGREPQPRRGERGQARTLADASVLKPTSSHAQLGRKPSSFPQCGARHLLSPQQTAFSPDYGCGLFVFFCRLPTKQYAASSGLLL